jgi:hypothetical protein
MNNADQMQKVVLFVVIGYGVDLLKWVGLIVHTDILVGLNIIEYYYYFFFFFFLGLYAPLTM